MTTKYQKMLAAGMVLIISLVLISFLFSSSLSNLRSSTVAISSVITIASIVILAPHLAKFEKIEEVDFDSLLSKIALILFITGLIVIVWVWFWSVGNF